VGASQNGGLQAAGNRNDGAHAFRVASGKVEGENAAERCANHGVQFSDAEVVEQGDLGVDNVAEADVRKLSAERFAGFWIDGGGAGRAVTSSEIVGADDEEAVGIHGFSRADKVVPPASLAGGIPATSNGWNLGVEPGEVLRTGQRVEDQNGIVALFVKFAKRLIGKRHRTECFAAGQLELVVLKKRCLDIFHRESFKVIKPVRVEMLE